MGGLLHLVQRGADWAGPQPAQAPPRCTLFYGVTQSTMNKLQRVHNNLARVVCDVGWRHSHAADLHWLPVRKRVMVKAASLCYRSCRFGQPAYLPLTSYIPARHLISSNSDRLNEPAAARIAIGERRFSD